MNIYKWYDKFDDYTRFSLPRRCVILKLRACIYIYMYRVRIYLYIWISINDMTDLMNIHDSVYHVVVSSRICVCACIYVYITCRSISLYIWISINFMTDLITIHDLVYHVVASSWICVCAHTYVLCMYIFVHMNIYEWNDKFDDYSWFSLPRRCVILNLCVRIHICIVYVYTCTYGYLKMIWQIL